MGTNYYWHEKPPCEACGRKHESLHIGKSSGGWCFSLHIIPEEGIHTLGDWRDKWKSGEILDENGAFVTADEMFLTITDRKNPTPWDDRKWSACETWHYKSELDFHASNHSQRGPNGLARHRIDTFCVGHGDGPWDYIIGEFS